MSLQIALLFLGLAMVFVSLGADLLGFGVQVGMGTRQAILLAAGVATALVGLAWDSLGGEKLVLAWARGLVQARQDLLRALGIAAQLAILILIAREFNLENGAFNQTLLTLVFLGFVVNFLLPGKLRPPFFLLLSLTAFIAILGLRHTLLLFGFGVFLITLASLPIGHYLRIALVLAAGLSFGLLRAELFATPIPPAIWPIFGSLFMFRLIIYINDTRDRQNRPGLVQTLSYFFLLPNIVFPLFPVVDLKAFRQTYYSGEQFSIYQRGVDWIFRGLFQLILYRIVNYYFVIAPGQIENIADLGQMMVANYGLYLRVSGQFHIAAGILHLFGFKLPETHHLYYLSTNFSEIWRRMNIYWKDFIQKIVFYPLYFKLRGRGEKAGLVLATLLSFVATWILHAYQWFWLRGSFLFTWTDAIFWAILGLLVLWNTLRENSQARRPALSSKMAPPRELLARTLKASGVFFTMSMLWSFWVSPSPAAWFGLWTLAEVTPQSLLATFAGMAAIVFAIGVGIWFEARQLLRKPARPPRPAQPLFYRKTAQTVLFGALLFSLGTPALVLRTTGSVYQFLTDIRTSRLSARDRDLLERGYYEDLMGVDRFNPDLWDLYAQKPADWVDIELTDAALRYPNDFLNFELAPSTRIIFHETLFVTNQWGMRDQDYEQSKPEGVFRIALVGSSRTMGSGVLQEQVFETIVENQLNERFAGQAVQRYEILNFSVGGYSLLHNLARLESSILIFEPDIVIIEPHPDYERLKCFLHISNMLQRDVAMPFQYLDELIADAGVEAGMPETILLRRFTPFGDDLLRQTFDEIFTRITAAGAEPMLLNYPNTIDVGTPEDLAGQLRLAEETGFTVIDLSGVYDGYDPKQLTVAPWDYHPNVLGHRLLAEAFYAALVDGELIPLP